MVSGGGAVKSHERGESVEVPIRAGSAWYIPPVIAGIVTNFAAEGTARDASDREYRVIVLADCRESVTDEMHQCSITHILPAVGQVVTAADFRESVTSERSRRRS